MFGNCCLKTLPYPVVEFLDLCFTSRETKFVANEPIIHVTDAGSVSMGSFHWVCCRNIDQSAYDQGLLAKSIVRFLKLKNKFALGYESP